MQDVSLLNIAKKLADFPKDGIVIHKY